MKVIKKHFESLRKAEQYQEKLYSKYDVVRLISFPTLFDCGTYIWEVE